MRMDKSTRSIMIRSMKSDIRFRGEKKVETKEKEPNGLEDVGSFEDSCIYMLVPVTLPYSGQNLGFPVSPN